MTHTADDDQPLAGAGTIEALLAQMKADQNTIRARDAALSLAAQHLEIVRAQDRRHDAELISLRGQVAQLTAELAVSNSERDAAQARVNELAPYEVSPKLQLASLMHTVPNSIGKRVRSMRNATEQGGGA